MSAETVRDAYRKAWEAWRAQLDHLHGVLLEGEQAGAAQMKGLLNREARAKAAYDRAREALLGIGPEPTTSTDPDANPFRQD